MLKRNHCYGRQKRQTLNEQDRSEQAGLDISIEIRRIDQLLPASRRVPRNASGIAAKDARTMAPLPLRVR